MSLNIKKNVSLFHQLKKIKEYQTWSQSLAQNPASLDKLCHPRILSLIMCENHGDTVTAWRGLLCPAKEMMCAGPLCHLTEDSALLVECAQHVVNAQQI